MSKPAAVKKVMKVWVVVWPKGTTEEWKHESQPPKDYQPIMVNPDEKYETTVEGGRVVEGDSVAAFFRKKDAIAWRNAADYQKCFVIRPAWLSIF